jgi:hypothetical protein
MMDKKKKKSMPPQPTAAERAADAKFRASVKNIKVTPAEGKVIDSANRSEGPGYKKGGSTTGITKQLPTSKQMGNLGMAKGDKVKMAPKFGAAMVKKSADTKGRAMVKKAGGGKCYASGGSVSSASKRADGCATKGKTKGKMLAMGGMAGYKRGGKTC